MSEKELIENDLQAKALEQQQEQVRNLERYHWLKEKGYVIFETITGSQAHGTNTPASDIDKAFVYILPEDDILGIKYKEQLKIHKDFMGYEIRRFLELLRKNNPTILELLYSPKDCILIQHPAFKRLVDLRGKFVTKQCSNSFYGYAKQQKSKAEGLEKMQNWEVKRVTKKNPIDFCLVPEGYDSIPVSNWLEKRGYEQLFCALTGMAHCRDLYALFYDHEAHKCFSPTIAEEVRNSYKAEKKSRGESMGLGYKGIAFEDSTDIRLSNISIEERKNSICHVSYNKDGYTKHCKDYNKYQTWLEERNETRWVEVEGHGQKIDGKNMMHFMRLVLIGREIAQGKGINIRRPDAEELLKIRRGEVSLTELFEKSEEILAEMKQLFNDSTLPDEVDNEFVHQLLVNIRKDFYRQNNGVFGFAEQTIFNSDFIKNEEKNAFILKAYGGYSEMQDFIIKTMYEKAGDGDVREYVSTHGLGALMDCFIYNSELWPNTRNTVTGKIEKVSIKNFSVVRFTRDKITVMAKGDDQDLIQFDVVYWQDTLAAINLKFVEEWKGVFSKEELFKRLGIIIDGSES